MPFLNNNLSSLSGKIVMVTAVLAGIATSFTIIFIGFYLLKLVEDPGFREEKLTKTYVDHQKYMGFSIKYSDKWTAITTQQDETEKVRFSRNNTGQNNCPLEVSVNIDDLGKAVSLEDYQKDATKTITQDHFNKLVEINEQTKLNNTDDTYQLTYVHQENRCAQKVLERGTLFQKKAYYIVYKAPDQEYDQFRPVVEKMMASFAISKDSGRGVLTKVIQEVEHISYARTPTRETKYRDNSPVGTRATGRDSN